jgi:hypothetical protein
MTGAWHEDLHMFKIIYQQILLWMRNVSDRSCRVNQNIHFMSSTFFYKMCHLWDNVENYVGARQAKDDNIVQCMHIAC